MAINLQPHTMMPMLALTAVITIFILSKLFQKKTSNPLPSPPALPIIGNLHQLRPILHRSLHSLSKKYGPILLLRFGSIPAVLVSSADLAEQVMKTQDLTFATRPPSSIANRLFYNCCEVALAPYGEHWRQMRKICVIHLLSIKMVQSFRSVIDQEVSLLLSSIKTTSPSPVNLSKMMMVLTNDIICRVALGKKYSGDDGFREMLKEASALIGSFPMKDYIPWLSWVDVISGLNARVRKNFEQVDEFLERVLEDHVVRRNEDVEGSRSEQHDGFIDFVDVLLSLNKDEETSGGFRLDRDSLKAIIWEMFAAGTDTISITLEWALVELITHPSVMSKAQEEVRRVLGSSQFVTEEDLNKMEYLKAVIKETLKMHPPVPTLVPREALQDTELQGYEIPKGTRLFINVWTISRDPKYWEMPEEFWPERFLNTSVDFKGQNFEFTPFGSGRRGCPGINFASLTLEFVLSKLLLSFDWEVPNENKKEVLDMTECFGITTHKKNNLLLKAKPYPFPSRE